MALTGQAKTDYQREYMCKRRSNARSNKAAESVRPNMKKRIASVRPSDGTACDDMRVASDRLVAALGTPYEPEPQSHNSMMVGYVPPTE